MYSHSHDTPKYLDSLISVYTVCHYVCIFWMLYYMVKLHCSNFRKITAICKTWNRLEWNEINVWQMIIYEPPHDKTNKMTCASAQSDWSLHCRHEESWGPYLPIKRTAKTLISLGGCPG